MTVTVHPDNISSIDVPVARMTSLVENLLGRLGFDSGTNVRIEVVEVADRGRARLTSMNPVTVVVEAGAIQDPTSPGALSDGIAAVAIGRQLLVAKDRLDESFGAPDMEEDISSGTAMAWDVHCTARLSRLGYPVVRQRRLYKFRDRFGFTDEADSVFEHLWEDEALTYSEISALAALAITSESSVDA